MKKIILVLSLVCFMGHTIFADASAKIEVEIEFCDENLNDICDNLYLEVPPPPVNDECTGAIELYTECGFPSEGYWSDPEATPDQEATGNCIDNTEPCQWYTFTTPDLLPYSTFGFLGQSGTKVEVFSTMSDCSNLVYEYCEELSGGGFGYFEPEPATKYYFLVSEGVIIFGPTGNSWFDETSCYNTSNSPLDWGWASTDCALPSDVVPCENDHVVWFDYTSCNASNITIEVGEYPVLWSPTADEISITVLLDDCTTLMSDYDVNGLGYVCSAMGGGESITLEDLPPGLDFVIGFGSSSNNTGYFEYFITESGDGAIVLNDICIDAELLADGLNESLSNQCATLSDAPLDAIIQGCNSQSEATVWYEYDPGVGTHDIVITLISSGINSPAIAAYEGCIGDVLAANCGSSIEMFCIDSPILIEVGSSFESAGTYDLDISSSSSQIALDPLIMGDNICSHTETNITIDILGGDLADIIVEISMNSSSDIIGMTNHDFLNVNTATINDILINTSSIAQEAIYIITILSNGTSCPLDPIEYTVLVYPGFTTTSLSIDECSPYLLELSVEDLIQGGSLPYASVAWFWNTTELLSSTDILSTSLIESGDITLNVIDIVGCQKSVVIDAIITDPIFPTFDFPLSYCRSEQNFIAFPTTSLEGIQGEWNIPVLDLSIVSENGFYDFVFMPNDVNCFFTITVTIEIFSGDVLEFDLPNVLCSEEDQYIFPTEDMNGIGGIWEIPSIDLSTTSGVQTNTFTPFQGCYAIYEYVYDVITNLGISFVQPDSMCRNEQAIILDNISEEGYEGTWDISILDPSLVAGDIFSSTWTPIAGQSPCVESTTITVQMIDIITPDFNLPTELCSQDANFTFQTVDNQSLSGTWSIPNINPSEESGIIQSIFTPDELCAETFIWEIEIIEPLIPEFNLVSTICALDPNYTLPLVSDNGISGSWSLPIIVPSMHVGEQISIVFQGDPSEFCIESYETTVEILDAGNAIFELPNLLCWTDEDLLLPTISSNGIEGTWTPSIVAVQPSQGSIISSVFIPNDGSCTNQSMRSFEIVAPYDVQAVAANPSDCAVADGYITIDIPQGSNLEFSIDGGASWQVSKLFSSLNSGAYIIMVRSADLPTCILELETYLNTVDGPIINDVSSTNIKSCIEDNGSITVDADGNNLEYSIDGGLTWQSSNQFDNLSSDSYVIFIREALSDCIVEAVAMIEEFPQTQIITVIPQDLSDCETNDGQIEILATGEALEYSIDNGQTWSLTNVFIDLSAGEYMIIVRSTIGDDCVETEMIELIAPEMPMILGTEIINPSQCLPDLGSMEVEALGGNLEYSIDGGVSWQDSPIFTDLDVDDYQLVIRDKDRINCSDDLIFSIITEAESLPESIFIITSPSVCGSNDGVLEVTIISLELEFSIDGGMTWQDDKVFSNLTSGIFTLISRKILFPECLIEQMIVIPDSDCPCNVLILTSTVDNISCIDENTATIDLSVEGMLDPQIDITWQSGMTGLSIEGVGFGWQFFTISYDEQCTWPDSVFVESLETIEFELKVEDNQCADENNGVIEILDVIGGDGKYEYSIDGENYQMENVFSGLESRIYNVFVRDNTNCLLIKEVEILSQEGVDISLPDIEGIRIGETIILDPKITGGVIDSFNWVTTDGLVSSTNLVIEVSPTATTTYTIEVYFGDCIEYKEITIEVLPKEEQEQEQEDVIHIGNIFSPNGDNINDFLFIQGLQNSEILLGNFSIYDRWGNMLFDLSNPEMNNSSEGWDGFHQGKRVNPGVYIYLIHYVQYDKAELKIGTVTLVH